MARITRAAAHLRVEEVKHRMQTEPHPCQTAVTNRAARVAPGRHAVGLRELVAGDAVKCSG